MKHGYNIVGVLLVTALLLAKPGVGIGLDHVSGAPTGQTEHVRGCHGQGESLPPAPLKMPLTYQCCLTGHNSVLVQAIDSTQPVVEIAEIRPSTIAASSHSFLAVESAVYQDGGPPGSVPLRI